MVCFFNFGNNSAQTKVHSYIRQYQDLSIALMHETGIPASIILSIAITESAAGTSRNARVLRNHFGIKNKVRYRIPGTKSITAYKTYQSDSLSYQDFCDWVAKKSFYTELKNHKDYYLWIKTLGKSGYARAHSTWKKKLIVIIEKYCLADFDCVGINTD
jgi:flagellum-specific peptidoglycan hydrolase FlgJ